MAWCLEGVRRWERRFCNLEVGSEVARVWYDALEVVGRGAVVLELEVGVDSELAGVGCFVTAFRREGSRERVESECEGEGEGDARVESEMV